MAPTKPAEKPVAKKEPAGKKLKKPANYDLGCGVYRFSKTKMYHKKAKYKFVGKRNAKVSSVNTRPCA